VLPAPSQATAGGLGQSSLCQHLAEVSDQFFYAATDEADAYMFYRCFFLFFVFSVCHKNTRQPFSGMAERIFMKLLPNDSGENGVCIAVHKWGLGPGLIFWG